MPLSFMFDPAFLAVAILAVTYLLVITDRFDRSIIALLGAGAMVVSGVLTEGEAIRGIDFNTIALFTGMMIIVAVARPSGVFESVAIWAAQRVRASPAGVLILLSLVTALFSSLLDNVTTVLLIAPVTLIVAERLEVAPFPLLFSEAMASNIGGAATFIGDPPNIMIGSAAGLTFNDFVLNLAPVAILVMVFQVVATHLIWGRFFRTPQSARQTVMAMSAAAAITDKRLVFQFLAVFGATLLGLIFARELKLDSGLIALLGAAILLLIDNLAHHREAQATRVRRTYADIDWITIFFFIGLFVVVHGVEQAGVLAALGRHLAALLHGNLLLAVSVLLWVSALCSAIMDNIPFVAAMIPLVRLLTPEFGGHEAAMPLWWALALGACLGGNFTVVGASANLSIAGIARQNGIPFGFWTYAKYGAPLTLMSLVVCQLYLWLRFG